VDCGRSSGMPRALGGRLGWAARALSSRAGQVLQSFGRDSWTTSDRGCPQPGHKPPGPTPTPRARASLRSLSRQGPQIGRLTLSETAALAAFSGLQYAQGGGGGAGREIGMGGDAGFPPLRSFPLDFPNLGGGFGLPAGARESTAASRHFGQSGPLSQTGASSSVPQPLQVIFLRLGAGGGSGEALAPGSGGSGTAASPAKIRRDLSAFARGEAQRAQNSTAPALVACADRGICSLHSAQCGGGFFMRVSPGRARRR
jgi:hypothetical protein